MNLSGRPLLDTSADHALFVGREAALRRIEQSLRTGLNCLVTGDPGSGKTTLVRALMYRSEQANDRRDPDGATRYTYVRPNSALTAAELLATILTTARSLPAGSQALPDDPVELVSALVEEFAGTDDGTGEARPPQVIVVDDVPPIAGLELFGALRDELWQVDARWLVTASTAHAAALLRPPADVFFETRVELAPLSPQEAAELLRARLDRASSKADEALVAAVVRANAGTPRRVLEIARELLAEPTVGGGGLTTVQGTQLRAAAMDLLSRPARMLAQELESLGWASASDKRLLDRMGWTRPRVVQVIGELEKKGLVQMREENTGRGRPRKLYRLTPAAEFTGSVPS